MNRKPPRKFEVPKKKPDKDLGNQFQNYTDGEFEINGILEHQV